MKWISHKLLTGAVMYAVTGNPFIAVVTAAGSIIPDAVEGQPDNPCDEAWQRNHRRGSHWFVPYLIGYIACTVYAYINGVKAFVLPSLIKTFMGGTPYPVIAYVLSFFLLGALFHIAEDALCGKVPLVKPSDKRYGIKLFYVGSLQEYAIVLPVSIILIFGKLSLQGVTLHL